MLVQFAQIEIAFYKPYAYAMFSVNDIGSEKMTKVLHCKAVRADADGILQTLCLCYVQCEHDRLSESDDGIAFYGLLLRLNN